MGKKLRSGWTTDSAGGGGQCEKAPLVRCSLMHATQLHMSGHRFSRRQEFAQPLQDVRGRLYARPFRVVHLEASWKLCRVPTPGSRVGHLHPNDCPLVGIPRAMYQLQNIIPNFCRWQGLLWAFTYVIMRGTAFVINKSTTLDAAKHCDYIVTGIQGAWSRGQAAEAFAALRRV
eukprot:5268729-Pyramimonas_sp.AAC.1